MRWVGITQLRRHIGIDEKTVRNLVEMGVITRTRFYDGGRWFYDLQEIDAHLEAHKMVAGAEYVNLTGMES